MTSTAPALSPEKPAVARPLSLEDVLPRKRELFYDGRWHSPRSGRVVQVSSPATGEPICEIADAEVDDVDVAVAAARRGFLEWRDVHPADRAKTLREIGSILRRHARELAFLDSADSGNPVREMESDVLSAATQMDFFAGLVTEMKGASIPVGPNAVNFSVREPVGVVARIVPFNHPFMFCAGKSAAPLAAGNSVIVKPPEQAPLSSLRLAELTGHLLPPGVLNVLPGNRDVGSALVAHPGVAMVALIGSVPTGRAVMRSAAAGIKPTLVELGGRNALIAFADADLKRVAAAIVAGMNFTWCGQSCGSTSRAFVHDSIHERVIEQVIHEVAAFKPGSPTEPSTTMGAIVSKTQFDRVLSYIEAGKREGARIVHGGGRPSAPELSRGWFIEPTIFADVTPDMTIAREELFGPVLSILRWSDEDTMLGAVNNTEFGLTCSIWTNDLNRAHRTAKRVEAGYVWINHVGQHLLGAPFGGFKQSGMGREECLEELLSFTQEKNIYLRLN
ncbi:MAG TPA: aldehyde dehydrogenase family protein [Xanthobacteraceae bacterium]